MHLNLENKDPSKETNIKNYNRYSVTKEEIPNVNIHVNKGGTDGR